MLAPVLFALAQFSFQVDADEFANVVYHVNCLSNNTPCTKPSIEKFWREDLHWTKADQQALELWSGTLDDIAHREPQAAEIEFLPMQLAFHPRLAARRRIIAAAFDSHSPADFEKRLSNATLFGRILAGRPALSRTEIAKLRSALNHFQHRLQPWWNATGRAYASRRLGTVKALLRSPEVVQLAGRIQRFMEAEGPGSTFHIHLIARHDPKSDAALATPVGNHLLLEVTDDIQGHEKFARAIVLHEMTHTFFDAAPQTLHRELIRAFVENPGPQSQALYSLLNEGLATAVQWIVLADPTVADKDLYRHPFIPRIGRAASVPLRHALENGPTLYHGFLPLYLKAAAAELKEEIASPRFILTSAIVAPMGSLEKAEAAYHADFATTYSASFGDRDRFNEMNLVILITYDKLDAIEGNWDDIVPLSKAHRAFAFTAPRNQKGRVYVIAGRDDQSVAEVVSKLAAIRGVTNEGLILSVD